MWQGYFAERHQRSHETFLRGSIGECAALLRNPSASDMQYGFELTNATYTPGLKASAESRASLHDVYRRALIVLADSIGAVRLPCEYPDTERPSNEDLVTAIEKVIGRVSFPNPYPDELGLATSKGIASGRAIQAIYQAWRIGTLGRGRIVEIGAGLGRTAYYAFRAGFTHYTIVDLPFTCLSSAYFLGRTLGEDNVSFAGERARGVRFMTPGEFTGGREDYWLAVNIDSLTELDKASATRYVRAIRRQAKHFLSINHESNKFLVGDLIAGGTRHLYPFRRGYAEQVFDCRPSLLDALRAGPLRYSGRV